MNPVVAVNIPKKFDAKLIIFEIIFSLKLSFYDIWVSKFITISIDDKKPKIIQVFLLKIDLDKSNF